IEDTFGEAQALKEQRKAHVQDLPGPSVKAKKKQLEQNTKKAKKELKKVNKRIVKQLKSEYDYDDLYDPQAEQAKRTLQSGMYKALSLHRALNNVFSGHNRKETKN